MANIPHIITNLIPKEKSILLMNIIADELRMQQLYEFFSEILSPTETRFLRLQITRADKYVVYPT